MMDKPCSSKSINYAVLHQQVTLAAHSLRALIGIKKHAISVLNNET